MRRLRAVLLLALLAGCKSSTPSDGYAIDLTIVLDSSVSAAAVAAIVELDLSVSGAETSSSKIPASGKFVNRSATLRYKPAARTSGAITLTMIAVDGAGAPQASGKLDLTLKPGTQLYTITLFAGGPSDGGVPMDMTSCGNNGSACTVASGDAAVSGVCQGVVCCTGCIKNGACVSGTSDASACGSGGNDCFDCTTNGATCANGTCSGCTAVSCGARVCGASSCGFNCGACADQCVAGGTLNHFACSAAGSCVANGGTNCGLYATCASGSTCATTCVGDNDCVSSAWCNTTTHQCTARSGQGGPCSAETTGDHECASPYVCTWTPPGTTGICAAVRCTGCMASNGVDCATNYIAYGLDPRHACTYVNDCQLAICSGGSTCDIGLDASGSWRPCGPVTCSGSTESGSLCSSKGVCQTGQTYTCGNSLTCCNCNSAGNACDPASCVRC
jgi:hypothetical protein